MFRQFFHHKYNKLFFLIICLLAVALIFMVNIFRMQFSRTKKINVLLISIDDLRADHIGAYGYPKDTTPNIDQFAKHALLFRQAYTNIPMTQPSFSAMMTGLGPLKSRIVSNQTEAVSENTPTLAEILQQNGYKTSAFLTGALSHEGINLDKGFMGGDYLPYKNYKRYGDNEIYYQTDRNEYESFLQKAINVLKTNSLQNQKSFVWIHLMDPHAPYQPPDELTCRFNEDFCGYIQSKTPAELEAERASLQKCQPIPPPQDKVELFKTLYDGSIYYTDQLVGKILTALKESGQADNTMVIIVSDHGEGFDHNYYFNHRGVLYNSAVNVPLLIKMPGADKGVISNRLISNTDLLPTILDLLQINREDRKFDGQSFSKVFGWNLFSNNQRKIYFMNNELTKFAIFDGRYKFIYSTGDSCLLNGQTDELYDLSLDPNEVNNLQDQLPKQKDVLKKELLEYLALHNLPSKKTNNFSNQNEPIQNFNQLENLAY